MGAVADNPARGRYEMDIGGLTAFVTYTRQGDVLILNHAEVPPAVEGQGYGSQLARGVLDDIRGKGLKVIPRCGFIVSFIRRNPGYADMVAR